MGDNLRFNFTSKLWLATHDIICEEARRYEYEINVISILLGKYEIMIVFGGQVSLIAQVQESITHKQSRGLTSMQL